MSDTIEFVLPEYKPEMTSEDDGMGHWFVVLRRGENGELTEKYPAQRISLMPIDVGFDLRAVDMAVRLPKGHLVVQTEDGEYCGWYTNVASDLIERGFRVEVKTPGGWEPFQATPRTITALTNCPEPEED